MCITEQDNCALFSNLTVLTVSKCEEYVRLSERKINKILKKIFCFGLIIVGAVGLIRDLILGNERYLFYILGFAGIIILAFAEQIYKTWGEKFYKRMLEINHGQPVQINSFFFADHFSIRELDGSERTHKYEDIASIKEHPNVCLVIIEGNVHLLLDKKGFTSENKVDYLEFIKSKSAKL